VHLSVFADVADAGVVRDQREPPRPAKLPGESQAASDNRAKTVGANDESSTNRLATETCSPNDSPAPIALDVGDTNALENTRAGVPGGVEKNGVEHLSPNGESPRPKRLKTDRCIEVAADHVTVRRSHFDSDERGGTGLFDAIQCTHFFENARRLRAEIFSAGLGSRERGAIDDERVHARAGQTEGNRRTGRTAANHKNFGVRHS
jgi:hypothetical protein